MEWSANSRQSIYLKIVLFSVLQWMLVWKRGSSQVLLQYLRNDCCHRNWQPITSSEQLGVGVRPPRATVRTITPAPPSSLPCMSVGVCGWACVQSDLGDRRSTELCFSPPPHPHHSDWGSVNVKHQFQFMLTGMFVPQWGFQRLQSHGTEAKGVKLQNLNLQPGKIYAIKEWIGPSVRDVISKYFDSQYFPSFSKQRKLKFLH